jgi:exopolyphosphatase / guanosine-5'-triphosphate,3'-diphosphate pyrophosphatase
MAIVRQPRDSMCLQHKALENWVLRQLRCVDHERRVAEIAMKLFDLTWPLHGLGRRERRLLRLAAIVHDVGRAIDDDTHPEQGARMLLETNHLPLTASERRALAYLTRYHRGKVPSCGMDEILRRTDDQESLRMTLALLRSADALDGRSIESPRLLFDLHDRRLQITCCLEHDSAKARKVYSRRKKHRLLEELCGCRVEVRIATARALQMVA